MSRIRPGISEDGKQWRSGKIAKLKYLSEDESGSSFVEEREVVDENSENYLKHLSQVKTDVNSENSLKDLNPHIPIQLHDIN
jgi:hypothetical protein